MIRIFLGLSATLAIVGSAQATTSQVATTTSFETIKVAGRTGQAIKADIRKAALKLCRHGPTDLSIEDEYDLQACVTATYEQGVANAKRVNPAAFTPAIQRFAAR